jgi:hypothetical protein
MLPDKREFGFMESVETQFKEIMVAEAEGAGERTELGHNHSKSARQGLAIPSYRRYSTPNALPFIIEDAHSIQ